MSTIINKYVATQGTGEHKESERHHSAKSKCERVDGAVATHCHRR